jgi:hypothetical protein
MCPASADARQRSSGTSSNRSGLACMPGVSLLLAAAAAGAAPAAASPDIELNARAHVREVRIEQQGEARVRVWAEPSAGDKVEVERNLPKGERRYRNLDIALHAEARLADPAAPATPNPSPTGE